MESRNQNSAGLFLSRLEEKIVTKTAPNIINSILKELRLHEFLTNDVNFRDFLEKLTTEPVDLSKLIKKIKFNFLEHEALCFLLANIQEAHLISDDEIAKSADMINLQLNMLCLFEAFTLMMLNGKTFSEDVYQHIIRNRGSIFPGNSFVNFFQGAPIKATIFERLKMISIDPGMAWIAFHKSMGDKKETVEDVNNFVKKFHLSSWNADIHPAVMGCKSESSISSMGINILEASWTDACNLRHTGAKNNSIAGTAGIYMMEKLKFRTYFKVVAGITPSGVSLMQSGAYELIPDLKLSNDTTKTSVKASVFEVSNEWRDWYNTWNLLFVIANLDSVLLPVKLILPSVFSATNQHYYEARAVSLFLIGNLFLSEQPLNKRMFESNVSFVNKDKIFALWGQINRDYSEKLLRKFCPEDKKMPEEIHYDIFGNYPSVNFAYYLASCAYNLKDFRVTGTKNNNDFTK